jgi:kynurenine 3-monooxygenase
MKSESKKNVAIIGGGPVGSSLALMLAKKGYNVDLFEKKTDPTQDTK